MNNQEFSGEQAMGFLFTPPFSDRTIKKGLFLGTIAFALILSVLLKAELDDFPLLGIKFTIDTQQGLQFALWIICAGKLVRYLPAFLNDFGAEAERNRQLNGFFAAKKLGKVETQARLTEDDIMRQMEMSQGNHPPDGYYEPDPWWEEYYGLKEKLKPQIEGLEALSGNYKLQMINRSFSIFIEGVPPIVLAIYALYIALEPALKFVTEL